MQTLRITHYGEPILTQKGEAIEQFDDNLRNLADQMLHTMYEANGIGLAAQQIDQAKRMCVVDVLFEDGPPSFNYKLDGRVPPADLFMPMALVNPEIKSFGEKTEPYEEGCLSFPDIRGDVIRPTEIVVEYQDLDGATHSLECDGILARCIQHEIDHLDGVLFIDRMDHKTLGTIKTVVKKLKKQTLKKMSSEK